MFSHEFSFAIWLKIAKMAKFDIFKVYQVMLIKTMLKFSKSLSENFWV